MSLDRFLLLVLFINLAWINVGFGQTGRSLERDIHQSPFRDITYIDYKELGSELDSILGHPIFIDAPTQFPDGFRTVEQKEGWLKNNIVKYPKVITQLPTSESTSYSPFIQLLKRGDQDALTLRKEFPAATDERLIGKNVHRFYAYQIHKAGFNAKKNVVVWAKEHADELNTSEFLLNFSDILIAGLSGELDKSAPVLANGIKKIFGSVNLIVLPDVTPDEDLGGYYTQDNNFFGVNLEPFDYDETSPAVWSVAPEAKFLKDVIDRTPGVVLGIDIHSPYDVSTIVVEDPSVTELARYVVAEGEFARNCSAANSSKPVYQREITCGKGLIETDQQISQKTQVSVSYLSRRKHAPGIFLEMGGSKFSSVAGVTKYNKSWDLRENIPYLMRLMEIAAFSKNSNLK